MARWKLEPHVGGPRIAEFKARLAIRIGVLPMSHGRRESTHKRTIEQLVPCIPFATIVPSQIIRLYHSSETYLSHKQYFCGFCPHILLSQTIFFIIAVPTQTSESLSFSPASHWVGSLILERKEKIMTTEAQINANRQNSRNSTGPRTEAGRNRSRFNAVKHGFRAEKAILPDEDPAALHERLDDWTADLQPRNSVEQYLVERGVRLSWQLDRVTRAQDARTSTPIVEGGIEEAELRAEEILEIGKRLFWDNRGPINFYPHPPVREVSSYGDTVPRTSFCESPDDPDQPALLVRRLQSSAAGCQWMLDRWAELETLVECDLAWLSPDKLKAIRLLGMQPIDAVDDLDVARIFLACFVIRGSTGDPFLEILHELYTREEVIFRSQLAARKLAMFLPKDASEAREVLQEIVARAKAGLTARLEVLRERDNKIKARRQTAWRLTIVRQANCCGGMRRHPAGL